LFNRVVDGDIVVKAYGNSIESFEKVFPKDWESITIGRLSSCDMIINDKQLSKVHATLKLTDGNWLLHDGDGVFPSTNGTWFYLGDEFRIFNGFQFKCNMTLFEATLY
jgi:hypothetical protein